MSNEHHNNIKNGDNTQSPTPIGKRCQHSCRNADETAETPTTILEQVSRWPTFPADGCHIKLLGNEPITTLRRTGQGKSPGTNTTIRRSPNNTQHSGSSNRRHKGPNKTVNSDWDTIHRKSSGTRGQELDANIICRREITIYKNHHETSNIRGSQVHLNQTNDGIPTRRQRPSDTPIPRSDITPNAILL